MFPAIMDGDVVFVRKDYDRIDNKIYVLDIDGETVVKRVIFSACQHVSDGCSRHRACLLYTSRCV